MSSQVVCLCHANENKRQKKIIIESILYYNCASAGARVGVSWRTLVRLLLPDTDLKSVRQYNNLKV